jgi:hypothetical protein
VIATILSLYLSVVHHDIMSDAASHSKPINYKFDDETILIQKLLEGIEKFER